MSFHIACFITSEKCGHCRNMRGDGILLSKKKIASEKKNPTIPGGHYYDASFLKKLVTADSEVPKLKVLNLHYKGFNPNEGVMDLSVFTIEPDMKTIRQVMLKQKPDSHKTQIDTYTISDVGRKISTEELDTEWVDTVKTYIPPNLPSYAFFYPTLTLFHFESWMHSIRTGEPAYGYVNGIPTKDILPYGANPTANPTPGDFALFLKSYFDGTHSLLAKPETVALPKVEVLEDIQEPKNALPSFESLHNSEKILKAKTSQKSSTCQKMNIRLYVKE